MLSDEKRAALIQMCHDAGVMVLLDSKFGRSEYTSVQSSWPALEKLSVAVAEAAVKDAVGGGEPVGQLAESTYGRGQVFWLKKPVDGTNLYERPQASQLNLDYLREMGRLEARIRELEQANAAVPEGWRDVVSDLMATIAANPSCQKGMVNRCYCRTCAILRAKSLLAASQPERKS